MQEMKIFDSDKPCYIRKKIIESNLLIRMTNWQIVFDSLIGPDIQFLSDLNKTQIIDHFRTSHIRSIVLIARCVRAIYRIMFFVHGKNALYNYSTMTYMTERIDPVTDSALITVRPLTDEEEENGGHISFDLYSPRFPARIAAIIKIIWNTINILGNSLSDDPVQYIITICAIYSYGTQFFYFDRETNDLCVKMAYEFVQIDYHRDFTVDEFTRRASNNSGLRVKAIIKRTINGQTIVKKLLSQLQTDFALVLLASLPSVKTNLKEKFANFIDIYVQVFPLFLIENVKSEYWAVVSRRGQPKRTPNGTTLTLPVIKSLIKRAKLSSPQSSADDDSSSVYTDPNLQPPRSPSRHPKANKTSQSVGRPKKRKRKGTQKKITFATISPVVRII